MQLKCVIDSAVVVIGLVPRLFHAISRRWLRWCCVCEYTSYKTSERSANRSWLISTAWVHRYPQHRCSGRKSRATSAGLIGVNYKASKLYHELNFIIQRKFKCTVASVDIDCCAFWLAVNLPLIFVNRCVLSFSSSSFQIGARVAFNAFGFVFLFSVLWPGCIYFVDRPSLSLFHHNIFPDIVGRCYCHVG
jgi:hypothetical protein